MPFYFPLRWDFKPTDRERTATNLLRLRQHIRREIPHRTVNDTLLLATWNIRDFDSNKFGHGPRLSESFFYIAEIIASFDIVAVQEVNADLSALRTVMKILGDNWDYIATDTTEGRSGNRERMAFVYDKRKVQFQNIAGEIVLPDSKLILDQKQFARTPFLVSFVSGWFKFMICTAHIYFGAASGAKLEQRIAEIAQLAQMLAKRADDESANYIMLGDFNIVSPEHKTMDALRDNRFVVPDALAQLPSNMDMNKHYDQIAFKERLGQVQFTGKAGVFNLFASLFREEDAHTYFPLIGKRNALELDAAGNALNTEHNRDYYIKKWRTFQMSDHLPMWVELKIDFANDYLNDLLPTGGLESFSGPQPKHPLSFSMPELRN